MTDENFDINNEKILAAAFDQTRKITNKAVEILTNPNHPDKQAVLFSKWESASITNNQSATIFTTERSDVGGQPIPLVGLFVETRKPHPGLISHSVADASDTTYYRHFSLKDLLEKTKQEDVAEYLKKNFENGTLIAVNPINLETILQYFQSVESFNNSSFQMQLYKLLTFRASQYDSQKQLDSILRDMKTDDNLPHPEQGYTNLFINK